MANQKSRFPSYGLVRGPSHKHGGVAGVVAGEQPVELEGGEWIIPKEVVPDYLPVLKQITNEGRAIQNMDNGNSAMDALIASASMETGLAQPKSPMYQDGGVVDILKQAMAKYGQPVDESLYTPQGGRSMLGIAKEYGLTPESVGVDTLSFRNPANYMFEITGETPEGKKIKGTTRATGALPLKMDAGEALDAYYKGNPDPFAGFDERMALERSLKDVGRPSREAIEKQRMMEALGLGEKEYDAFMEWKNKNKQQGGPVNYYQDGGAVDPTWGQRFTSMFPSQHEDEARALEQQRGLAGLIDFFVPQSAAEAGLMLAAGPIVGKAGRVLKGAKGLPKLSKKAKAFITKSKEGEHLEEFARTEPGMAGPIDWSKTSPKTIEGRRRLEEAKQEYGRRKRLSAEAERYEAKYADDIAQSLNPYDNPQVDVFMDDAIYNSGMDIVEALAARKAKFGYQQGGPVNYYQDGGKAEEAVKFRSPLLNKQKYTMTDLMALEAGMPKDEMLVGYDDIGDMDSPRVKALQELAGVLSTRIQSETQDTPEYGLERHLRMRPERSVLGHYLSTGNQLQRTIDGIPMIDPVEVRPEYQQGGQIQPRKQQEMRNPEVYGPPVPADIDSLLNQI